MNLPNTHVLASGIVYDIHDNVLVVLVIEVEGHYGDK